MQYPFDHAFSDMKSILFFVKNSFVHSLIKMTKGCLLFFHGFKTGVFSKVDELKLSMVKSCLPVNTKLFLWYLYKHRCCKKNMCNRSKKYCPSEIVIIDFQPFLKFSTSKCFQITRHIALKSNYYCFPMGFVSFHWFQISSIQQGRMRKKCLS